MKSPQLSTIIPFLVLIARIEGQTEISSCGQLKLTLSPLMTHAIPAFYWPWHAAIFHQDRTPDPSYQCGGTVISSHSILTAAHCVSNYNKAMESTHVIVTVGRLNLSVNESTAQWFEVAEIIIHPNYTDIGNKNDIAVIRLSTEVTFNDYVQPVCLWNSIKTDLSEIVGRSGTVVGWGKTEADQLSNVLLQVSLPVISDVRCLTSNRRFVGPYLSEMNFCAGLRNGTSVCMGDSGGSMTLEENGIHYIRGIVSVGPATIDHTTQRKTCDTMQYVLFTDVAKYLPWLAPYALTALQSWEIKVRCEPEVLMYSAAECHINLLNNHFERSDKISFDQIGNTNVRALNVRGESRIFPDLSDGVTKFANLDIINMENTKLEIVKRTVLAAFSKITQLFLGSNQITQLDADTFNDLKDLKVLKLDHNQLKELPDDLFKELYNLETLFLNNNKLESLPEHLFANNGNLRRMELNHNQIKELHVNLFEKLEVLVHLSLNDNQLGTLDSQIFRNNLQLQTVDQKDRKEKGLDSGDTMQYVLFTDVAKYLPWLAPYALTASQSREIKVRCEPEVLMYSAAECHINLLNNHFERSDKISFDQIGNTNVRALNVRGESRIFPDLSDGVTKFANLHIINMENTKLEIVKRTELAAFSKITQLFLGSNQITQLDADTFNDLKDLKVLKLDHNQLKELPDDLFKELYNLETLFLNNNRLESLPENLFANNGNLRRIELKHNQIKELHVNLFEKLEVLVHLSLNHNQLETLDSHIFRNNLQLQTVDLKDNKEEGLESRILRF